MLPDVTQSNITVRLQPVATGLNEPVGGTTQIVPSDLVPIPDASGRLFVSTLGGVIRVIQPGGGLMPAPYFDMTGPNTSLGNAHGFTSIALHPGFADPGSGGFGKFYTLETEEPNSAPADFFESVISGSHHDEVIYEYTAADPAADVFAPGAPRRELLRVLQPGFHHNLGDLLFDPQGRLFITAGDGNFQGVVNDLAFGDNAGMKTNIFGKILRIDPLGNDSANGQYGIPDDNPFRGEGNGVVEEIYAYGLRNPYRISFDRETGELYAGDVGEEQVESVDRIVAGGNYGWNQKEGGFVYDKFTKGITEDVDADNNGIGDLAETAGLIDPILQYGHQDGRSVIGGFVYRGSRIPRLQGKYVFGDWNRGFFYGDMGTGEVFRFQLDPTGTALPSHVLSIGEDVDGELYILGDTSGAVLKILPLPVPGDANGDGIVNIDDLNEVRNQFGMAGPDDGSLTGDTFPYDGSVNIDDLNAVRNNFGAGAAPPLPEPSTATLALLAAAALLCRLRCRRRQVSATPRLAGLWKPLAPHNTISAGVRN